MKRVELLGMEIPPGLTVILESVNVDVNALRRKGINVITEEDYRRELRERFARANPEQVREALRAWEEAYEEGLVPKPPYPELLIAAGHARREATS
ncbi:MAG: hypothetical protein QXJ48_04000 [Candidatus Korarchaeum sp.]